MHHFTKCNETILGMYKKSLRPHEKNGFTILCAYVSHIHNTTFGSLQMQKIQSEFLNCSILENQIFVELKFVILNFVFYCDCSAIKLCVYWLIDFCRSRRRYVVLGCCSKLRLAITKINFVLLEKQLTNWKIRLKFLWNWL